MQAPTNEEVMSDPSWGSNTRPTSLVHILNNSNIQG